MIFRDPCKQRHHHQRSDSLLFHGCPQNAARNIQDEGLKMSHAKDRTMLGRGLYGAPDPRKASHYSDTRGPYASNHSNTGTMFICRFNLSAAKHAGPSTSHRNTVFDEFCVYDEQHVVVLWMLHYVV